MINADDSDCYSGKIGHGDCTANVTVALLSVACTIIPISIFINIITAIVAIYSLITYCNRKRTIYVYTELTPGKPYIYMHYYNNYCYRLIMHETVWCMVIIIL